MRHPGWNSRERLSLALLILCLSNVPFCLAQSGLRESIERLDRNSNGYLEPEEVTPLSRPYLERILGSRRSRVDFDDPISINRILDTARYYYAERNGVSGRNVEPRSLNSIRGFGSQDSDLIVPEFGAGELRFPYRNADLAQAKRIMSQYDRDGDGFIDRREAARNRWTHRNPFDDDIDGDDRISLIELTQRYARRRLLDGTADELRKKRERLESVERAKARSLRNEREDRSSWYRRGGSKTWLTASLLGRFDANKNGRLEAAEIASMGLAIGPYDVDRDGELTRDELLSLITELQEEAGDLTEGLPGWFYELDQNRDGQIAFHEFRVERTAAENEQFQMLDINGDGMLLPTEILKSAAAVGSNYRNAVPEVLPPRKTVISEIEIKDEFVVSKVALKLSITHTYVGALDAYLTGPDGTRIELFSAVGGSGDHFNATVIDDDAGTSIKKGSAPFEGSFRPEPIDEKKPGLSSFKGKNAQGIWQLVIRASRSDRFGMLHHWGLDVKPMEGQPGNALSLSNWQDNPELTEFGNSCRASEEIYHESRQQMFDLIPDFLDWKRREIEVPYNHEAGAYEVRVEFNPPDDTKASVTVIVSANKTLTSSKSRDITEAGPKIVWNSDTDPETVAGTKPSGRSEGHVLKQIAFVLDGNRVNREAFEGYLGSVDFKRFAMLVSSRLEPVAK